MPTARCVARRIVRTYTPVGKVFFGFANGDGRARPLVLVCTAHADLTTQLVTQMSEAGLVACVAHSAAGCLRVATAVGPDVVLVDASVPDRVISMLRTHPACRTARVVRLTAGSLAVGLLGNGASTRNGWT